MAFIDDNMPVTGHQIGHHAVLPSGSEQGDIDFSGRLLLSSMDNADLVGCDVQKGLKACHPLIEKLPAMHKNQGVPVPRRDHLRRDDSLAESRCRGENPGIVHQKLRGGDLLFRRQFTQKAYTDRAVQPGVRRAA